MNKSLPTISRSRSWGRGGSPYPPIIFFPGGGHPPHPQFFQKGITPLPMCVGRWGYPPSGSSATILHFAWSHRRSVRAGNGRRGEGGGGVPPPPLWPGGVGADSGIRALRDFPEVRYGLFSGLLLGSPHAGHLTRDRSVTRDMSDEVGGKCTNI